MRIDDSLADGVSFFMAELKRLKEITEEAERCRERGKRTLLFLLDEILQGTNSRERHIAVERVLGHLVEMQVRRGGPPISVRVIARGHLVGTEGSNQWLDSYFAGLRANYEINRFIQRQRQLN